MDRLSWIFKLTNYNNSLTDCFYAPYGLQTQYSEWATLLL